MRLIDADEFDDLICAEQMRYADDKGNYTYRILEAMRTDVRNRPTVDASPVKHGCWEDVGSLSCRCSECGCKNDRETRFCPNCGAKMDLEDKEYAENHVL